MNLTNLHEIELMILWYNIYYKDDTPFYIIKSFIQKFQIMSTIYNFQNQKSFQTTTVKLNYWKEKVNYKLKTLLTNLPKEVFESLSTLNRKFPE